MSVLLVPPTSLTHKMATDNPCRVNWLKNPFIACCVEGKIYLDRHRQDPGKSDHFSGETAFLPWFCEFIGFIELQCANYNSSVKKKKK